MDTARSKQPPSPAQSSSPAQPWKHPLASILAAQSQPAAAGGVQAVEGWGCPEVLDWLDGARLGGSEHAAGGAGSAGQRDDPTCLIYLQLISLVARRSLCAATTRGTARALPQFLLAVCHCTLPFSSSAPTAVSCVRLFFILPAPFLSSALLRPTRHREAFERLQVSPS